MKLKYKIGRVTHRRISYLLTYQNQAKHWSAKTPLISTILKQYYLKESSEDLFRQKQICQDIYKSMKISPEFDHLYI